MPFSNELVFFLQVATDFEILHVAVNTLVTDEDKINF